MRAIHLGPVPVITVHASLRVHGHLWVVEEVHVEAAYVVRIILYVVVGTTRATLVLIDLVGSWGAHVAVHVEEVVAHSAARVAAVAKHFVVCYRALRALASHHFCILCSRVESSNQGLRGILDKLPSCVAQVAISPA